MTDLAAGSRIPNPAAQLHDPQNGQGNPHGIGAAEPQCRKCINTNTNAPLNAESTNEDQQIQRRAGATGEFFWKWFVTSCVGHDA